MIRVGSMRRANARRRVCDAEPRFLPMIRCARCGAQRVCQPGLAMAHTVCTAPDADGAPCGHTGFEFVPLGDAA